jgi:site-specific recombinase XerD
MRPKSKRITGTLYLPSVTRYVDANGKRVTKGTPGAKVVRKKSATWRARYHDADGVTRTCSLFDDRETSEAKLAEILQRERELKAGIRRRDPFEIHRTTPLLCPKCEGTGCKDAKGKPDKCGNNHLDAFQGHLSSKDGTERHVTQSISRIRKAFDGCRFATLEELDGGRLSGWLKDQRKQGMSPATSNAYLTALKGFGNWLFKDRRHLENPFGHLSRVNQRVDVRIVRRSISPGEVSWLVAGAESGNAFRGLTGQDRAMLYVMAAFTGLRASELHSLTERSLNFQSEPPTVTLEAAYSKHRREDVLPLHPELARKLREWLQERHVRETDPDIIRLVDRTAGLKPDSERKLFPGTWPLKAAKMIRLDLKAARTQWLTEADCEAEQLEREDSDFLIFETDDGRADFHSLRHTFISNLAGSGVHPKLAKELARHSTITLTMDRYSHVGLLDMNSALESLPGIPTCSTDDNREVATGTDQSLVATLVATIPAECRSSHALSEANPETKTARITGPKSLPDEELPPLVITPDEMRAQGFEPWTYGLKVRCSTN